MPRDLRRTRSAINYGATSFLGCARCFVAAYEKHPPNTSTFRLATLPSDSVPVNSLRSLFSARCFGRVLLDFYVPILTVRGIIGARKGLG